MIAAVQESSIMLLVTILDGFTYGSLQHHSPCFADTDMQQIVDQFLNGTPAHYRLFSAKVKFQIITLVAQLAYF